MEADGDTLTVPKAGVGMVLTEMQLPGGDSVLAVKSLAPGAPAALSRMINLGDILQAVDGKRVAARQDAAESILGEIGSIVSLQSTSNRPADGVNENFEPNGEGLGTNS